MATTPLALSPALPSELLIYVLAHQAHPITVIICQRRTDFFDSLLTCIPRDIQAQPSPPLLENDAYPILEQTSVRKPPSRHQLLIPTLHQIATSRYINLIYIPSVSHLRAYLAVFPPTPAQNPPPEQKFDKPGKKPPLLVVYGLLELHRDTSEWSAQGLGNSVAGLVEAGRRCGRRVLLLEERKVGGFDIEVEANSLEEEENENQRRKRMKVWEERVPMLNGSVKRAGLESEDEGWSGRTVEVGRILARWFQFGKSDWDEKIQS